MPEKTLQIIHGYVDNNGVKIHYAAAGKGPLVVMIHGFPDFWYTWRHQMAGLSGGYRVVAIDQRGYNLSDQPEGVENYDMRLLVSDVAAVVRHLGEEKAVIVGHDWGGVVAWNVAFYVPEIVDKLIILNLPHPNGVAQALQSNPDALAGTTYAKVFRESSPDDPEVFFGMPMTAQTLSSWVTDEEAQAKYIEAFERSDFTAMLNYYKCNYPDVWSGQTKPRPAAPNVNASTLMFHGLEDTALHSDGLNNTWDWVDKDLTLVTVPGAGHFVQQDAAELVTNTMRMWLDARRK
ncbi:MAG: alpha/beta hydrolase [Gammaproteobacteria bacterium]|nr:alpha/beta hydrolase [Gammaproteobacteria bacterium]MDH3416471.1 alpha/beta hydrolase [Gammaproteobacteria bacterium]